MKFFATLLLVIISFGLLAQNNFSNQQSIGSVRAAVGKVTGSVYDMQTKSALPYCVVVIQSAKKDSLIKGVSTDEAGKFAFDQLRSGRYKLMVKFVGYNTYTSDAFLLTSENPAKDFDKIYLSLAAQVLKEGNVTAEKNVFVNSIDKKVFNVDKSVISAGGNANDVLQQIPSVTVDIDGKVALRGNDNVTILIDGKPSSLTGDARQAVLKSLPAGSIESIELITNPSAKYSAEGMGGIINIVLKKNKLQGINGLITAGIGTGSKYNSGLNLSYRNKWVNAFAAYNYHNELKQSSGYNNRQNIYSDTSFYILQQTKGYSKNITNMIRFGSDFYLNDKNTLGFMLTANPNTEQSPEYNTYQYLDEQHNIVREAYRNNAKPVQNNLSVDYNLNYRRLFAMPKQELSADLTYSTMNRTNRNLFAQDNTFPVVPILIPTYFEQIQQITATNQSVNGQLDYTQPVGSKSKIETGGKLSIRSTEAINNNITLTFPYQTGVFDSSLSSHYQIKEKQNAAYFTYSGVHRSFLYSAGLRSEFTRQDVFLVNAQKGALVRYWYFFPSAYILQPLSSTAKIQLGYSRRINRPDAKQIIPFTDYSDPQNKRIGNPDLLPELINSYEATYYAGKEKYNFSVTGFYRHSTNLIIRYRQLLADGSSLMSFKNAATSDNYGVETIERHNITKWWDMTNNLNFFKTKINATNIESDLQNDSYSWMLRSNNNIRFWQNAAFQFSVNYNGPMVLAQGKSVATLIFAAGVKKDFLKNKLTLSINANDITNRQRMQFETAGTNFKQNMMRKRESQIVMLNVSYRFGNTLQQEQAGKKNKQGGRQNAEMNGGGGSEDF